MTSGNFGGPFLIAGGNSTLLVWGCPQWQKELVIKKYLGKVEQIGFVEVDPDGIRSLNMMGNELCINATLALASQLGKKGELKTSSLDQKIEFTNLDQISYLKLSFFAKKYSLPAFGSIFYQGNKITPYVYVRETNSLVKETACGSGSIACSIVTGYSEIIHLTGQSILVRQRGDVFIVGAKVVKIGESYD